MPTYPCPTSVDTIVVGAGTGGAAFTGMLAAHSDESILLLEAGPDYGAYADGGWPADVLNAKAIPLSHDYDLVGRGHAGSHPGPAAGQGARRLLGAQRLHRLGQRAGGLRRLGRQGNPGWEAATVEPLLDWVRDRFRVRRYRMDELTTPRPPSCTPGSRSGCRSPTTSTTSRPAVGIGPMPVNIVDGVRWNAAFAFLDPVRARPNLTIAGDATVRRVLFDGTGSPASRSTGRTGPQTIRAGRVVVAGGAYHSPALLLRSGIGPAADLRGARASTWWSTCPGVGRHLLDHACVGLHFHGKQGLLDELAEKAWNPDEQSLGRARSSRCDDGPYDIHVFMVAGANSGHPGLPPISLYGGAMRAALRRHGHDHQRRPVGQPGHRPPLRHRPRGPRPRGPGRVAGPAALDVRGTRARRRARRPRPPRAIRWTNIVNYCHPAGTCKMGPASDPARSSTPPAPCTASPGCTWPTPRSCRPSPAATSNLPIADDRRPHRRRPARPRAGRRDVSGPSRERLRHHEHAAQEMQPMSTPNRRRSSSTSSNSPRRCAALPRRRGDRRWMR